MFSSWSIRKECLKGLFLFLLFYENVKVGLAMTVTLTFQHGYGPIGSPNSMKFRLTYLSLKKIITRQKIKRGHATDLGETLLLVAHMEVTRKTTKPPKNTNYTKNMVRPTISTIGFGTVPSLMSHNITIEPGVEVEVTIADA